MGRSDCPPQFTTPNQLLSRALVVAHSQTVGLGDKIVFLGGLGNVFVILGVEGVE